jgi:mono/diheme cytochrome c family protein
MKKILKIFGLIILAIVLLVGLIIGYAAIKPMKTFEVSEIPVTLPTDSASLVFGENIVTHVCGHCHMAENGKMSGRIISRDTDPFGELYAGNLTHHPEFGLDTYSDGQIAWLLRTGTNKNGRFVGHMMTHPLMSDEHLASIIAFLRSDHEILKADPVERKTPKYAQSALIKAMVLLGLFKPLEYSGKEIKTPNKSDHLAYGRYLALDVLECIGCHSESFETVNLEEPEKTPGFFGGGNMVDDKAFNKTPSANITPSKEFGIGLWTEADLKKAIIDGFRPDGSVLKGQMPRYVFIGDDEIKALYTYLQSIAAIEKSPEME